MPIRQTVNQGRVPVHLYTDEVESRALEQLVHLAQLPFIHGHVAGMPDVHYGIGTTVGSVIPTRGAIIPAAVGVDIGCGMNAVRLSLTADRLPDSLQRTRRAIERVVPVGQDMHTNDPVKRSTVNALEGGLERIMDRHPAIARMQEKKGYKPWVRQLGTLGGGNHFIEVCLDEDDAVWIMLHSGSRGIGNQIGRYFIELAKNDMEDQLGQLPDANLAYFTEGAKHFEDYVEAVEWAQDYALINRREMMRLIIEALQGIWPSFSVTKEAINCHHNYVTREMHFGAEIYVTRKGAIRAGEGELGIIPGSMGARSYIVRGKGNPDSLCSCAHGAGRRMSRGEAKRRYRAADVERQTEGIECRKDKGVIDELPEAYKDIDAVMANQTDLVDVVHTLKQVVCVKG